MKSLLYFSIIILLCLSNVIKSQEVNDNEDYDYEEIDDTTEDTPDLELIPSFKAKTTSTKKTFRGSASDKSDQTPLNSFVPSFVPSFVSSLEQGTFSLFGSLRERLNTRVQQMGQQLQNTQQTLNKRVQNGLTSFTDLMQGLPS